jgi:peptidyl-dipeptidase Dcp
MAAELVEKIKQSRTFNQGYELAELVSAAALDMEWHTLPPGREVDDVGQFEAEALAKANVNLPQVPPRYRSSYFLHIWSHGYSAGYYAYLWTEMLDQDAYGWFEEQGGMTRENGQRFRDLILSRGNTRDYAEMYREFRGRDPIIEPMLEHRGLMESTPAPSIR